MFAVSITVKLLVWYLALHYGDAGNAKRPWLLGLVVGSVFAAFDLYANRVPLPHRDLKAAIYLATAILLFNVYYRLRGIAASLAVVAIGTAVMFLLLPYWLNLVWN